MSTFVHIYAWNQMHNYPIYLQDKSHICCWVKYGQMWQISYLNHIWTAFVWRQICFFAQCLSSMHWGRLWRRSLKYHCDEIFQVLCFCIFWIFKWYLLTCPSRFVQQAREDGFFKVFPKTFLAAIVKSCSCNPIRPCCFVTSFT